MSAEVALRRLMLGVAALACVGLLGELVLVGHTESWIQLVPVALSTLALAVVLVALAAPARSTLLGLRVVMMGVLFGSAFGIYEHLEHNYAFEAEIRPSAGTGELLVEAVFGGSPLLAPGGIALVALLAIAATYRDPRLADRKSMTPV